MNHSMQKIQDVGECSSNSTLEDTLVEHPLNQGWEQSPGLKERTSPGPLVWRTPILAQKSCRTSFKSPVLSPRVCQPADKDTLQHELEELKHKDHLLDNEIAQIKAEGYSLEELDDHINLLHKYNEIKDTGQMLLGRLAVIRGVTTKELYPEFDLDLND